MSNEKEPDEIPITKEELLAVFGSTRNAGYKDPNMLDIGATRIRVSKANRGINFNWHYNRKRMPMDALMYHKAFRKWARQISWRRVF